MIKTLIKHIIGEAAIDALFSNMTKNFSKGKPNRKIVVGQRFNIIEEEYTLMYSKGKDRIRLTIYNATVTEVWDSHFKIVSDRPFLRENLSDGTSGFVKIANYHSVFYDGIKYLE